MSYFALAKQKQRVLKLMVPWMSGLVSGLQNHVRRFESARYLRSTAVAVLFYLSIFYGRQLFGKENGTAQGACRFAGSGQEE